MEAQGPRRRGHRHRHAQQLHALPLRRALSPEHPPASARVLGAQYVGYFGALGVYGPFLALYLESRGFRLADSAFVLAALPLVRVAATPAWTLLADRWKSAGRVLRIVGLGALVSWCSLPFARGTVLLVAALLTFTVFRAPVSSLTDALALDWVEREGGEFGRLRAWGTVAYTAAVFGAGVLVQREHAGALVPAAAGLLAVAAVASVALPRAGAPSPARLLPALGTLLRRPRFVLLLVATGLHQVGLAAYDGLFTAEFARIASPTMAGAGLALGAGAEVAVMAASRRMVRALGLEGTLALSYAGSCARWWVMSRATDPRVLLAAQVLHGLTFGAFYVASVALVDRESPAEVRASAQGLFGAFTWGLASAGSLALAGWLEGRGGMRAVFSVATGASAVGTLLAIAMRGKFRERESRVRHTGGG